jgi:hypothetical protein
MGGPYLPIPTPQPQRDILPATPIELTTLRHEPEAPIRWRL